MRINIDRGESNSLTKSYITKPNHKKTGVINDPLVQTQVSPVANLFLLCFVLLDFEKWGHAYVQTTCAKTMIPTGRDCGLAEWIKKFEFNHSSHGRSQATDQFNKTGQNK